MSVWVWCSSLSLRVGVVWVIEKWEGLFFSGFYTPGNLSTFTTQKRAKCDRTHNKMVNTFAPELEQIFAQHKVDDEMKKYLLGLTPPIATVASFASLVGPDDELTTLLFGPAGISALEPPARTPATQAKATFAAACGPKETRASFFPLQAI